MNKRDREALECIIERNGANAVRETIDDIIRERRISSFVRGGMTRTEAEEYANELEA
jgi:hypothetical protein